MGFLIDDVDVVTIFFGCCTNAVTGESLAKTRIVVMRYDVMLLGAIVASGRRIKGRALKR